MRRSLRDAVTQLRRRAALFVAVIGPLALVAATPPPGAIDLEKAQSGVVLPKVKLHTEFIVEVNKLGQVTRVRSAKTSANEPFNAQTYGNAMQAFIRRPDGSVLVGSYTLTYDFDPGTKRIRRGVALLKAGGVDPNAKGAVTEMEEIARRHTPAPEATPLRIDPRLLPELPSHSPR